MMGSHSWEAAWGNAPWEPQPTSGPETDQEVLDWKFGAMHGWDLWWFGRGSAFFKWKKCDSLGHRGRLWYINELLLEVSMPWVASSHNDSGHGYKTCFGQWDIGTCDTSGGLKTAFALALSSWKLPWDHHAVRKSAEIPHGETGLVTPNSPILALYLAKSSANCGFMVGGGASGKTNGEWPKWLTASRDIIYCFTPLTSGWFTM